MPGICRTSNHTYLNYKLDQWISLVKTDSVTLEVIRNDSTIKTRIGTVNNHKRINQRPDKRYAFTTWKLISDSIGYINMGLLNRLDINPAYKRLKNTKYLIIDSRNYPHWVVYPLAKNY
ncbi:MAG: hypothetical protein HC905_23295 [Bacteroidales bacterium]|nr:hypothetical protein [Bacteroidales bacterium]